MNHNSKNLDLLKPLTFLLFFCIGVAMLFVLLSSADRNRKEKIYQTYATETQNYIQANKDNLIILFTMLRGENPPCQEGISSPPYCPLPTRQEQINKLTQDLKDWSSTAFLFKSRFNDRINITRLSGDTQELHIYPTEKEIQVKQLLNGEINQIPWENYTYELPNKEVIISVKDTSGRVIGAIIRGVIEQNRF